MKGWTKRYWEQYDKDNPQPPYKQASLDSAMGLNRIENRSAVSGRQRRLAAAEKKLARTARHAGGMVIELLVLEVLVYYYTVVCDVTVTRWNFQIGLDLPFKGCRSRKNCVYILQ